MKAQIFLLSAAALAQTGSTNGSTGSAGDCNSQFSAAISQANSACPGVNVQMPVNNNNACKSSCLPVLQGIANGNLAQVCGSNSVALNAIQMITQQVGNCPFVIISSTTVAPTKTNSPKTTNPSATQADQSQSTTTGQPSVATTNGPAAEYPTMANAERASTIAALLSLIFML